MNRVYINFLLAIAIAVCAAIVSPDVGARMTTKYDHEICKQSAKYLVGHDCDWLKAQLIQESALRPTAKSPVGAMGLGQIMPATYREICKVLLICHISPYDPKASIMAAAYYQARMEKIWKTKRSRADRKSLGQASYNAGAGHIIKAQKLCGMASKYQCIINCLPQVTGHHSKETIGYVKSINKHYLKLKAGLL